MSDEQKTVRVYVAVAVDRNGHWFAGGSHRTPAVDAFEYFDLPADLEPGESRYILTAELPLPAAANVVEVEGAICHESHAIDPSITKRVQEILDGRGIKCSSVERLIAFVRGKTK